jgi:hypothetical protein
LRKNGNILLKKNQEQVMDKKDRAIDDAVESHGHNTHFKTDRGGRRKSLDGNDVDVQIEVLLKNKKYAEAFDLLSQVDYPQGLRIISGIRRGGWKSTDPMGRELQERLEAIVDDPAPANRLPSSHALSIFQDFRPMFLGREAAPRDEKTLLSWLEDRDDFRHRSAAVITLAERGFEGLPDVVNRLCADPYWQVRMAAAGAELLKPGSLTPANRALLEQDHVYWVQALLKAPASGRLADLGPRALEALEKAGTRSDPKNRPDSPDDFFGLIRGGMPGAVRDYFLILGEYLSTDGVWCEDDAHDAGDAAAEIESDHAAR